MILSIEFCNISSVRCSKHMLESENLIFLDPGDPYKGKKIEKRKNAFFGLRMPQFEKLRKKKFGQNFFHFFFTFRAGSYNLPEIPGPRLPEGWARG